MMATEVKPNTLVQYKGGGYEGCFWEWNFAYFDANGKFHNIVATGYKGCKKKEEMIAFMEDGNKYRRPDYFLYDLTDPESILEFGTEANPDHALGVAKWFAEKKIDVEFRTICDECGENVPVLRTTGEGLSCAGGIVYQHDKTVCLDCIEKYSCSYCGDFMGEGGLHPETGLCCDKRADGTWVEEDDGWCHNEHGDEYR